MLATAAVFDTFNGLLRSYEYIMQQWPLTMDCWKVHLLFCILKSRKCEELANLKVTRFCTCHECLLYFEDNELCTRWTAVDLQPGTTKSSPDEFKFVWQKKTIECIACGEFRHKSNAKKNLRVALPNENHTERYWRGLTLWIVFCVVWKTLCEKKREKNRHIQISPERRVLQRLEALTFPTLQIGRVRFCDRKARCPEDI